MEPSDDAVRVGVLSLHNSKETKAILNAVEDLGPHYARELVHRDDLAVRVAAREGSWR